uniref:TLR adaptor interacting with endolysosomal SLC15A4 n=1 Tax=Haplochromis burtoni TaxID=8153 RepID=A0A3Q2VB32_HAPBU
MCNSRYSLSTPSNFTNVFTDGENQIEISADELDSLPSKPAFQNSYGSQKAAAALIPGSTRHAPLVHHNSPEQITTDNRRASIPAQAHSGGDTPFLVPSFCQSFCKNYSDLHIAGDQVLPLSANNCELRVCANVPDVGPFIQSCDVPPAVEDSLQGHEARDGMLFPLRGGSNRWRLGSGRDRSFLLQGHEGPFSNSLLNHYLEQKLLDLYQQYMMENMAREGAPGSDSDASAICPLLGSELVLTSLDQITLQLSREGNMEAGLAKDMVLSCFLRVAGDMQSSEISTPFLQISNEP